jgi:hypothetical protein
VLWYLYTENICIVKYFTIQIQPFVVCLSGENMGLFPGRAAP